MNKILIIADTILENKGVFSYYYEKGVKVYDKNRECNKNV